MRLIMSSLLNRPLPSSKHRNFQNEAFYCANEVHLHQNIKSFHITCFAFSLALKQRLGELELSEIAQPLNRDKVARVSFSHKIQYYAR